MIKVGDLAQDLDWYSDCLALVEILEIRRRSKFHRHFIVKSLYAERLNGLYVSGRSRRFSSFIKELSPEEQKKYREFIAMMNIGGL